MSDRTQKILLTVLTIAVFEVLNHSAKKLLDEQVPERRGAGDDLTEASLQAVSRAAAVVAASVLVRTLANRRRRG
jgi:hypothetical protein